MIRTVQQRAGKDIADMDPVRSPASLTLALDTHAPSRARAFLREVVGRTGADGVFDQCELLISELVTNAVRYGGPPIELVIRYTRPDGLEIHVSDGSTVRPVLRHAAASEESGRGMELVDAISDDWGVDTRSGGKTVWFRVGAPSG